MKQKLLLLTILLVLLFLPGCNIRESNENLYTGTIEGNQYVLSAEITGTIQEVETKQGSHVVSGDTLVKINTSIYQLHKKQAQGLLKSAKARETSLPDSVDEHAEDEARGAVEQAQASVDLAQLQIDKGKVNAVIDGIITEIFVNRGEFVAPGTPLLEITDLHDLYVDIYMEESKRPNIQLQDKIKIINEDKEYEGIIRYISAKSEFTPKNVETKDEKSKTLFKVEIQLPENMPGTFGSMVDVIIE